MALKAGAIRFNTDSSQMEIYDGNQWTGIESTSPFLQTGGTRGVFAGGSRPAPATRNVMDFGNLDTTGNFVDFGDLQQPRGRQAALSNGHGGL